MMLVPCLAENRFDWCFRSPDGDFVLRKRRSEMNVKVFVRFALHQEPPEEKDVTDSFAGTRFDGSDLVVLGRDGTEERYGAEQYEYYAVEVWNSE
jgi:hypothetical protein